MQKNSSDNVQEILIILRPNQKGFDDVKAQEAVKIFKQAIQAVFPNVTAADAEKVAVDLGLNEPIAQWADKDAYFDELVTLGDGQFYPKIGENTPASISGG